MRQVIGPCQSTIKAKDDDDIAYNWRSWNGPQRFERIGTCRTNLDHPNYNIVKFGQNIEKSPGDLRGLAATQIQVKDPFLTLVWETRQK